MLAVVLILAAMEAQVLVSVVDVWDGICVVCAFMFIGSGIQSDDGLGADAARCTLAG